MILVVTATGFPGVDPRCMDKIMKKKHGLYLSLIFVYICVFQQDPWYCTVLLLFLGLK